MDIFWNTLRQHLLAFGCFSVAEPFSLQVKLFSLLLLLLSLPEIKKI